MSILGRRDSEPPAEEAHEGQAEVHQNQAEARAAQEPVAEPQAEEPAPAFWRAQGQTPASLGRDPADAPAPAYDHEPPAGPAPPAHGQQASGEAPAPVVDEALAGADTPVVADALAGPAVKEIHEPTEAVAHEPAVNEAQEPTAEAGEPVMAEAQELAGAEAQGPAATGAPELAATGTRQPTAAAITPQRWSEILVAFVDDPRGSVKMAAGAVDEAIDEFVNSVRARQRDLASAWQSDEADTEQLRTALREYRKLGQRVQQLDLGEKTGA